MEKKTIEWFTPDQKLPKNGQECLLMPKGEQDESLLTIGVFGPIKWDAKMDSWIDIFRDPEAGTIISKDKVGRWTAWGPISPWN